MGAPSGRLARTICFIVSDMVVSLWFCFDLGARYRSWMVVQVARCVTGYWQSGRYGLRGRKSSQIKAV